MANGRPEARAIEALLDVGSEALVLIASTLSCEELASYARHVNRIENAGPPARVVRTPHLVLRNTTAVPK